MVVADVKDLIFEGIPTKQELILIDTLLFSVYRWTPDKIRKMKLLTLGRWIELAKKRMTWEDAYKLNMFLQPKRSLWKKIKSRIRF